MQPVIDGYTNFVFLNRFDMIFNPGCINRAIVRMYTAYNAQEKALAIGQGRPPLLLPHFSIHILAMRSARAYARTPPMTIHSKRSKKSWGMPKFAQPLTSARISRGRKSRMYSSVLKVNFPSDSLTTNLPVFPVTLQEVIRTYVT